MVDLGQVHGVAIAEVCPPATARRPAEQEHAAVELDVVGDLAARRTASSNDVL
jgi:hypothetical protein